MNSIEKNNSIDSSYNASELKRIDNQNGGVEKTKLAIFDFDGTLVHSKDVFRQVNIATMKYYNLKITEEIITSIFAIYDKKYVGWGRNLEEQIDIYVNKFEPMVSQLSAEPRFYRQMRLFNGMRDVIKELAKTDIALAVASSRDLLSIMKFLQDKEMKHHFSAIEATQGGKVYPDKPNPKIAYQIMNKVGVETYNAVMIGDSACDIKLGKNAGIKTIGVGYGGCTSAEEIAKHNPDVVIRKEEEISLLPNVIKTLLSRQSR